MLSDGTPESKIEPGSGPITESQRDSKPTAVGSSTDKVASSVESNVDIESKVDEIRKALPSLPLTCELDDAYIGDEVSYMSKL